MEARLGLRDRIGLERYDAACGALNQAHRLASAGWEALPWSQIVSMGGTLDRGWGMAEVAYGEASSAALGWLEGLQEEGAATTVTGGASEGTAGEGEDGWLGSAWAVALPVLGTLLALALERRYGPRGEVVEAPGMRPSGGGEGGEGDGEEEGEGEGSGVEGEERGDETEGQRPEQAPAAPHDDNNTASRGGRGRGITTPQLASLSIHGVGSLAWDDDGTYLHSPPFASIYLHSPQFASIHLNLPSILRLDG